jgi:hypothetical protein
MNIERSRSTLITVVVILIFCWTTLAFDARGLQCTFNLRQGSRLRLNALDNEKLHQSLNIVHASKDTIFTGEPSKRARHLTHRKIIRDKIPENILYRVTGEVIRSLNEILPASDPGPDVAIVVFLRSLG